MLADGKTVVCSSWDNNVYVEKTDTVDLHIAVHMFILTRRLSTGISTPSRTAGDRTP